MSPDLDQTEAIYAKIFTLAPFYLAISSLAGKLIEVNETFVELSGYSRYEALGKSGQELGLWLDPEAYLASRRLLLERGYLKNLEIALQSKTGEIKVLNLSAMITELSGEKVIVNIALDISERRRAELKLVELNENLLEIVDERTLQIEALTKQLSNAEQNERESLARTLHDTVQQDLYAMGFIIKSLKDRLQGSENLGLIDELETVLTDTIENTRAVTKDLHPPGLEKSDFCQALGWLANDMKHRYGLEIKIEGVDSCEIASKVVRTLLFNLTKELLFNIVKHAEVSQAIVRTDLFKGDLIVGVIDWGKGFDVHKKKKLGSGLGLSGAHKRLEYFGGNLSTESQPGKGTRVTIRIPQKAFLAS